MNLQRLRAPLFACTRLVLAAVILLSLAADVTHAGLYRWTDAAGNVHFGDRRPDQGAGAASDESARYRLERQFRVEIVGEDYTFPAALKSRTLLAAEKIYRTFVNTLGLRIPAGKTFTIRSFENRAAFTNYRRSISSYVASENSNGFYSIKHNEIVVWKDVSERLLFERIVHENVHAVLGQKHRFIPAWLNEGLAEYFRHMEIAGQAVTVPPSDYWDRRIRRSIGDQSLVPLTDYLSLSNREFYDFNNEVDGLAYGYGWSLVYFLMSSGQGRSCLSRFIGQLDDDKWLLFSSADTLDSVYPNGMAKLEEDWRAWVSGSKQPHYY